MSHRPFTALAMVLAVMAQSAASAQAASVRLTSAPDVHDPAARLVVVAGPGEVNQILIGTRADGVGVADFGTTRLRAGEGCVPAGANGVHCPTAHLVDVRVVLGDGDDRFQITRGVPARVSGGEGDDVLLGSPFRDELSGGPGRDSVAGGHGSDVLDDGPGDDLVEGGSGHDVLRIGSGRDRVDGGPGDDRIRLADREGQEADRVTCGDGADRVIQPRVPDRLDRACELVVFGRAAVALAVPRMARGVAALPVRCEPVRARSRCRGTVRIAGRAARFSLAGGTASNLLVRVGRARSSRTLTISIRGERRTARRGRTAARRLGLRASWRVTR